MYISGSKKIIVPEERHKPNGKFVSIQGANSNNLKNINIDIPIGLIVCVTGVSGSGKSTLVNETLYKYLSNKINKNSHSVAHVKNIKGWEEFDKIIEINQSPIGRTPRSNPATYTGLFTLIRDLFASTKEARSRGYTPGRFSFNVKGGRCESCHGDGVIKWRCIFFQMFMFNVIFAKVRDIIMLPLKFYIRIKTYLKCWI